mgnify:CR=1 FL=1
MEGKVFAPRGDILDYRILRGDDGLYRIWWYIPQWGLWEPGLKDRAERKPGLLLERYKRAHIASWQRKVRITKHADGTGPPVEVCERPALPYWFSQPDNPEVPGLVESVRVVDGREVAHIREGP